MPTWTLTTSGSAIAKAGTHANSTITASGSTLLGWSNEAEGRIESESGKKWVDNYSALPTGIKGILSDVCSSLIAIKIVAYDPTGYITREADLILNVQDDIASKGMAILRELKGGSLQAP